MFIKCATSVSTSSLAFSVAFFFKTLIRNKPSLHPTHPGKSLIFADFLSFSNFWVFTRKDATNQSWWARNSSTNHPLITSRHLLTGLLLLPPYNFNPIMKSSPVAQRTARSRSTAFNRPITKDSEKARNQLQHHYLLMETNTPVNCFHLLLHVSALRSPGLYSTSYPCLFPHWLLLAGIKRWELNLPIGIFRLFSPQWPGPILVSDQRMTEKWPLPVSFPTLG